MTRPRAIARRYASVSLLVLSSVSLSHVASAEPSPREKAAAEALFQQATALIEQGKYAEACSRFEGSQEMDPALGTMLRLADCYDRVGRTASAWAVFQEAAAVANSANSTEREQIAAQRARDLEGRLAKVSLDVAVDTRVPGLQVRLNGVVIPSASWNAPLPVDPGAQKIEASAPDRQPWSGSVEVPAGPSERAVEIPLLAEKPLEKVAEAQPLTTELPRRGAPPPSNPGATQRTLGYITGGIGLAGLLTGGVLAYRAYDLNEESLGQCRASSPNACTPEGKGLRDDAKTFATSSTIAVAAGGALFAAGVTLVLSAPSAEGRNEPRTALSLRSMAFRDGARFTLEGNF